jgi:Leucine-rich repeat (LRR) protein
MIKLFNMHVLKIYKCENFTDDIISNMNIFPNLQELFCSHNQLTSLHLPKT